MKVNALTSLIKTYGYGTVCDFAIWFQRNKKDHILFIENTANQKTKMTAHSTHYPTQYGFTQTEFKYKEPTVLNITGLISRKGTGVAGFNFGLSSLVAGLKTIKSCINETKSDIKYLLSRQVLCEVWSLNGGIHQYMTLTGAEIIDDRTHVGLFEVDLTFEEVPMLILEPEPVDSVYSSCTQCGLAQCVGK